MRAFAGESAPLRIPQRLLIRLIILLVKPEVLVAVVTPANIREGTERSGAMDEEGWGPQGREGGPGQCA